MSIKSVKRWRVHYQQISQLSAFWGFRTWSSAVTKNPALLTWRKLLFPYLGMTSSLIWVGHTFTLPHIFNASSCFLIWELQAVHFQQDVYLYSTHTHTHKSRVQLGFCTEINWSGSRVARLLSLHFHVYQAACGSALRLCIICWLYRPVHIKQNQQFDFEHRSFSYAALSVCNFLRREITHPVNHRIQHRSEDPFVVSKLLLLANSTFLASKNETKIIALAKDITEAMKVRRSKVENI